MTRVAVDLDGVVVDLLHGARNAIAADAGIRPWQVRGTGIYRAPFTHDDPAVAAKLVTTHDFWQRRDVLEGAIPMPGAIEALRVLAGAGMLAGYVTRRPEATRGITSRWLASHGAPSAPLLMVGDPAVDRHEELCKADACREIGATHLVDDSQEEAERALASGVVTILVDHPLGRAARTAWLRGRPDVGTAADLVHAVSTLVRRDQRLAG